MFWKAKLGFIFAALAPAFSVVVYIVANANFGADAALFAAIATWVVLFWTGMCFFVSGADDIEKLIRGIYLALMDLPQYKGKIIRIQNDEVNAIDPEDFVREKLDKTEKEDEDQK